MKIFTWMMLEKLKVKNKRKGKCLIILSKQVTDGIHHSNTKKKTKSNIINFFVEVKYIPKSQRKNHMLRLNNAVP